MFNELKYDLLIDNFFVISNSISIDTEVNAVVNCNSIFVNVVMKSGYKIQIQLTKNGIVKNVVATETFSPNRTFRTLAYVPSSNFLIKNFIFNNITKSLYFEFDGILVNTTKNSEKINFKGKIQQDMIGTNLCQSRVSNVYAKINNIEYQQNISSENTSNLKSKIYSFSDNGLSFEFITEKRIENTPLGEYQFNEDSTFNKIIYANFIGVPYSAALNSNPTKIDSEWQQYNYNGTFIITEKITGNQGIQAKGTFSINVYDLITNELKYTITDGTFVI